MSNRRNPLSYRYGYSISWPHIGYYGYDTKNLIILHQIVKKYIQSNENITNYSIEINQSKTVKLKFFSTKVLQKSNINVSELSSKIINDYNTKIEKFNSTSLLPISSAELKVSIDVKPSSVNSAARIAKQIEEKTVKRGNIRSIITKVMKSVLENGVEGIKIIVKGRLGGAEMSSTDKFTEGRMPLSSIKAVIDYHQLDIKMPYGVIGLKVFIYTYNSTSVLHKSLH